MHSDVRKGDSVFVVSKKTAKVYEYRVLIPPREDGAVYTKSLTTGQHVTLEKGKWFWNTADAFDYAESLQVA